MHPTWRISPAEGVAVTVVEPGTAVFECPGERAVLRGLSEGGVKAIRALSEGGATVSQLLSMTRENGEAGDSSSLLAKLRSLVSGGWVWMSTQSSEGRLATLQPLSREFKTEVSPQPEKFCLSRFALLRRIDNELVLETPLCAARIRVHSSAAVDAVFRLREPQTIAGWCASLPLDAEAAGGLLALLHAGGMLTEADAAGVASEDLAPALQFWEFHDLLFHSRSREGRNDLPVGATFFWAGQSDPPPAVVSDASQAAIALDVPENYPSKDPASLANVVERRRSHRAYGKEPLSVRELGQFLYRVGRVTERSTAELETWNGPITLEFAARPYPAGGGLYEIELYPLIVRCAGLESGLYHYDPVRHALVRVAADAALTDRLATDAAYAATMSLSDVQVLLILSARFPRMMWKYSAMAYAATLKHVGVLYEAMYLTATDLQLAPCAVGIGNSDVFARALGSDYYAETSVGEFLLGSRSDSEPAD